jgi:uncharacterized protein YbjT (DUF2867 family)
MRVALVPPPVFARAVNESGITKVVFMSSVGAHHEAGTGLIRSLYYAERRFAEVKADITFLRGSYFIENWEMDVAALRAGDVLNTFLRADHKIPQVAVRDLGNVIAELLTRDRGIGISSPDLPSGAGRDRAGDGEVTGKSVRCSRPASAAAEALVQFGATAVAVLIQEFYEGLDLNTLKLPVAADGATRSDRCSAIASMWRSTATGVDGS